MTPPKVLVEAGVIPDGEKWVVTGAMYGLTTAPRDWGCHRDAELKQMQIDLEALSLPDQKEKAQLGFQPAGDSNLWAIREFRDEGTDRRWGEVRGYLIVYVDDILGGGPREVTELAARIIRNKWATSDPEYSEAGGPPMRFLGMEIQKLGTGDFLVHQECYTRELLERHGDRSAVPFIRILEEKEAEVVSQNDVRQAQKITGELLWLSGRTRPDLAAAVTKMAQQAMRNPKWSVELGENVLGYLAGTRDYGLHYGAAPDRGESGSGHVVEILVDASFGPGEEHSITGVVVMMAGAPVQWESKKQGLISLSTAEAELTALLEGLQAGRSVRALLELMMGEVRMELYNDNRAALILGLGTGGGWRTRHLRIRARCLAEALQKGELSLSHRPGTELWADALTKCLPAGPLDRACRGLGLVPAREVGVRKAVLEVSSSGSGDLARALMSVVAGATLMPAAGASPEAMLEED